jgi:tetratricopeptide (TPR) repeat protein
VAFDRDSTLRKAEKLLRQGRLDAAIAEYLQVIEDQPRDWNTANILGDLYVRAGQVDRAVAQYTRIADHLGSEGFLPKASAVYKKILKIKGDEEHSLLQLAEIAVKQGLLVDAKAALTGVADRRTAKGDRRGAAEVRMRLGTVDPGDLEARLVGARAAAEIGETSAAISELKAVADEFNQRGRPDDALKVLGEAAALNPVDADVITSLIRAYVAKGDFAHARKYAKTAAQFKQIAAELSERGHEAEALEALTEAAALDPADLEAKVQLVRRYLARQDTAQARRFLTVEVAGDDPELLWMLAEMELRAGKATEGLAILQKVVTAHPSRRDELVLLGCSVADVSVETAYQVIDLAASLALANDEWADAAAAINEFVNREPRHIPALMRLVEICVDGGLEATMYSAQGQLADAYLATGQGNEARVIAEDLVAREPWERANIERFRRALTMLGETDVDAIIADRLSGQTPFVSTDLSPGFEDETPVVASPAAQPDPSAVARALSVSQEDMLGTSPLPKSAMAASTPELPAGGTRRANQNVFDLGLAAVDLGFLDQSPESTRTAEADTTEAVEIDLSNMLEELKPSMADAKPTRKESGRDLEGVFKDFRDEVSRENVADAAAQHYKLAIAYMDMGMVDDALKALQVSARAPRLRFESAAMIARIYLKRNQAGQAIEWFERAAEAPAPNPDAGRALLYELAETLESQGETARALAVFLELRADAGEYRDVSARLERLTKVQMRG